MPQLEYFSCATKNHKNGGNEAGNKQQGSAKNREAYNCRRVAVNIRSLTGFRSVRKASSDRINR